jgi:hypothetical protein
VLVDKKFQLEQAVMDMETIDALDTVGDHLKEQEKYSEKLQDIILDGEEAKMRQKEIDDKMRDMVGGESDEEEVDVAYSIFRKCSTICSTRSSMISRSKSREIRT